jgi:hypothetical protein
MHCHFMDRRSVIAGAVLLPLAGATAALESRSAANVRRFGAKGDGVTDDTAAIQAAIDSGAPEVFAPPGTYVHTRIELGEGQTLRGAGMYGATRFKLGDGAADYVARVGLRGLTAKSGIAQCAFRDFEYDGNAANNRGWGSGSARWAPGEYDRIYTQGLYFGPLHGRVAPRRVSLSNLYVHDTVRSNVVWGGTRMTARNLHLANSDADHLLYESGAIGSIVSDILCEGFGRGGLVIVSEGTRLSNVTVRNLTANPTIYDTDAILCVRNYAGSAPAEISNVAIDGLDPDVAASRGLTTVIMLLGSCTIDGIRYRGSNSAHRSQLVLLGFSRGQGSERGYRISDFHAGALGARTRLMQVDAYASPVADIALRRTALAFANGRPAAGQYLFNFQGSVERLAVEDLTVTGTMMNLFAVSAASRTIRDILFRRVRCASVNGRVATFNSRDNIVFEDCDFGGLAATDLAAPAFFDHISARNVRVGRRRYGAVAARGRT